MNLRTLFYLVCCFIIIVEVALWMFIPILSIILAVLTTPVIILGFQDILQKRQTLRRNYPLFGRGRYWMEWLRPKIYQYFVESDIDGRPINRIIRSVVYQRAKQVRDSTPFGTQLDVYEVGYEWINHSMNALPAKEVRSNLRVNFGGPDCKKPYSCSLLNVSAMSFGALSKNAITALNWGANLGHFAHNTGEGSISPYHLKKNGDLIWQIGTGYFGCRTKDGQFCPDKFQEKAQYDCVKMIEIKLSQGAKPGHGGILPASKNNPEIARIRGVEPYTTVNSPPRHSAFSNPVELLEFIQLLRDRSGGKPIGFKLCSGNRSEFVSICMAMIKTGIKPDFIAVDGGEGGTGAAPLEFSNHIGMPLREGLVFISDILRGYNLKKDIRIIASGKLFTGFDIVKALALGADASYTARAMMLALGCIQALECNSNTCPAGIATQNPGLVNGLDIETKARRIYSFHHETIHSIAEIVGAAGFNAPHFLGRAHINRRISNAEIRRYDEIFPVVEEGSFQEKAIPDDLKFYVERAKVNSF